jgi:hypothetical protein
VVAPKLFLGRILATPGALLVAACSGINLSALLRRHATGDWGDLPESDRVLNDFASFMGDRVLSRYDEKGHSFYLITEADRSATTIMLRDEY